MDTASQLDPRIIETRRQAENGRQESQAFIAAKNRYRQQLLQLVSDRPELRRLEGDARVGLTMAVEDAATYHANSDRYGRVIADNWLAAQKQSLRAEIERMRGTQTTLTAIDTAVTVAGAAAGASREPGPLVFDPVSGEIREAGERLQGVGRAAGMGEQAAKSGTGLAGRLGYLESKTLLDLVNSDATALQAVGVWSNTFPNCTISIELIGDGTYQWKSLTWSKDRTYTRDYASKGRWSLTPSSSAEPSEQYHIVLRPDDPSMERPKLFLGAAAQGNSTAVVKQEGSERDFRLRKAGGVPAQ